MAKFILKVKINLVYSTNEIWKVIQNCNINIPDSQEKVVLGRDHNYRQYSENRYLFSSAGHNHCGGGVG